MTSQMSFKGLNIYKKAGKMKLFGQKQFQINQNQKKNLLYQKKIIINKN